MDANKMDDLFNKMMESAEGIIDKHGEKEGFSIGAQIGATLAIMSFMEDAHFTKDREILAFAKKACMTIINDMKGELDG